MKMQVTGFKWKRSNGQWQPHFIVYDGVELKKLPLWAAPVKMILGKKYCIGNFTGGSYSPCADGASTQEMICEKCKTMDDFFLCVQCKGDDCKNRKQRHECEKENYVIYLASFGTLLKVGISREARFFERLIEQGADFGTKLTCVKDGMYVRRMEQAISKYLKCPDRIDGEVKQELLFSDPNSAIIQLVKAIAKLKDANWEFPIQPEIYDFRGYYRLDSICGKPSKLEIREGIQIKGRIVAAKGNIIVARSSDGAFSFDARRIVGREILSIRAEGLATHPDDQSLLSINQFKP